MSVVFSTTFTEGNWSAWTSNYSSRASPYSGYGASLGPSNTCNHGVASDFLGTLQKEVGMTGSPPVGVTNLAVRFQYAIWANKSFETDLYYICAGRDTPGAFDPDHTFSWGLAVLDSGAVQLYLSDGNNGRATFDSAAGVFPTNGAITGVQIRFSGLTALGVTYDIRLNNTSVLSGTYAPTASPCTGHWGYFTSGASCVNFVNRATTTELILLHYRDPLCGPVDIMTNCAEFLVDDDPAAVSYPANTARAIGEFTCFQTALATVLTIQCGAGTITIGGTDFSLTAAVQIQGPGGTPATFDIVSRTPTEIVVQNLSPAFVNGATYCATVTNPCI